MNRMDEVFIFIAFMGCFLMGCGVGYSAGLNKGWDESRDFTYETLNSLTDENIVVVVRHMGERKKRKDDDNHE